MSERSGNDRAAGRPARVRAGAVAAWGALRAAVRALELRRRFAEGGAIARRDGAALAAAAATRGRALADAAAPAIERARGRSTPPPVPLQPASDPELAAMLERRGLPLSEQAQADPPRPKRPARPAPLFDTLPEQPAPLRLPPAEAAQYADEPGASGVPIGERARMMWRALPDGRRMMVATLGGVLAGAMMIAALGQTADPERARIEGIVHDYLMAHPEVIPQAIAKLRERETAQAVATQRQALETPFAGAWAGNPDGDVVLVEFFDYACGYCRQSVADVDRLIAEDKGLKVVFRELPVLGETSDEAARVSLSAAKQGRFLAFHRALYAAGRPSVATLAAARRTAGLDAARVNADVQAGDTRAEVESNLAMAQALSIGGTPTFVVGDQLLGGAVGYAALKAAIAKVRAAR